MRVNKQPCPLKHVGKRVAPPPPCCASKYSTSGVVRHTSSSSYIDQLQVAFPLRSTWLNFFKSFRPNDVTRAYVTSAAAASFVRHAEERHLPASASFRSAELKRETNMAAVDVMCTKQGDTMRDELPSPPGEKKTSVDRSPLLRLRRRKHYVITPARLRPCNTMKRLTTSY